jgi:hypothetical protein
MSDYRHKETGEVKNQGEWRAYYKNTSLPRTWTTDTLSALKLDAVLEAPKPTIGPYETITRNGVQQDSLGNWVIAWAVRDMFADTTDEDEVTTTKGDHEAAYQATLDATAATVVRLKRTELLSKTDWTQLADAPTDAAPWANYRQDLRDITDHLSFPYLGDDDWPKEP